MAEEQSTLSVTDNRTGRRYELPIEDGTVRAGALSTFYPDAKEIRDEAARHKQVVRLIAKTATIAAFAYRHALGLPYAYPDNDLSYAGNFLNMLWKVTELRYRPDPALEHALDV